VKDEIERVTGRRVLGLERVGGGCINQGMRAELDDGSRAFVKTRADVPPDEYTSEAAALRWLAEPQAVNVPRVLGASERVLAIEWIDEGRLSADGAEQLGRGLAKLHAAGAEHFGGEKPLRIGSLEIPNGPSDDWPSFYAEKRLLALIDAVDAKTRRAIELVAERIETLAGPTEKPARLHGDAWGGNVLADKEGEPWLIDPIAYGGHREVDLAMLRLFGSPHPRILDAYAEAAPLADGHEERVGLWQLFPLLVHAALFGGHYASQVEQTARRYI
jgi:fructosamine-3-kinase